MVEMKKSERDGGRKSEREGEGAAKTEDEVGKTEQAWGKREEEEEEEEEAVVSLAKVALKPVPDAALATESACFLAGVAVLAVMVHYRSCWMNYWMK